MDRIIRHHLFAMAVFGLLAPGNTVHAQEPEAPSPRVLLEYEERRKNSLGAGLLEYAVPFAGYAYAGHWRDGLWPAGVYVAGLWMLAPCGLQRDLEDCSEDEQDTAAVGFMVLLASRIWGGVGAARTANRFNRELLQRLQIELRPEGSGLSLHGRITR